MVVIRFSKQAVNSVVVTLTENSTTTDPVYLFLFTNQQSKVPYYFIAEDLSLYKQRYNRFSVTEKNGADTLNGEVSLGNEGFYDYTIYETSLTDDDLTTAQDAVMFIVKEVEVGTVWVVPQAVVNTEYNPASDQTNVYQNNGYILTESGDYLLQETGFLIEME